MSMWSKDEDTVLREQVRTHGAQDWDKVCLALHGRTAKCCRLRWCQYLDPLVEIVKPFTPDEDVLIVQCQAIYGNSWSTIAGYLPGRTDNAVKNRWNSVLRRDHGQHPPHVPCAGREPTPEYLPLFPLVSGDVRGVLQGFPQDFPMAPEEEEAESDSDAATKCLELFPLAPGDLRDNAIAAAICHRADARAGGDGGVGRSAAPGLYTGRRFFLAPSLEHVKQLFYVIPNTKYNVDRKKKTSSAFSYPSV